MTTRSARSASRRIALRTLARLADERLRRGRWTCCLTKAARARSAWARTARVIPGGTRWRTIDGRAVVPGQRVGEAQGELGVRAAADRDEDPPDLGRAALLDDRDVARRLADDLVDRGRDDRAGSAERPVAGPSVASPLTWIVCRPPQPKMMQVGLLLGGRLDDPLGGVPADPDDRMDRRSPSGA